MALLAVFNQTDHNFSSKGGGSVKVVCFYFIDIHFIKGAGVEPEGKS